MARRRVYTHPTDNRTQLPPTVTTRMRNTSLSQQMALIAAGLCLIVSLALVALSTISSRHMQTQIQQEYGAALAHLIAQRISTAIETSDLLRISASLQRFVDISAAQSVSLKDVEGKTIGKAGTAAGMHLQTYIAPVRVETDIAGQVEVTIGTQNAAAAQTRFTLTLLGLSLLLSLAVYIGTRMLAQRLGTRLMSIARALRITQDDPRVTTVNEIALLEERIAVLPMDLLRTRSEPVPQDENYKTTAVLYLGLSSLVDYVETLDEELLHRYTDRLHQLVFAAAGFYAGDLQVARQFGLAIYFSDHNQAGSAAFRAASCAWLVHCAAKEMEKQMSLSMRFTLAIEQSELGVGNSADIYPGLYMQHTLDELQAVCASRPPQILLSPAANADADIGSRVQTRATEINDYHLIEMFHGTYQDLLERQLRLMLKRLTDPARLQ